MSEKVDREIIPYEQVAEVDIDALLDLDIEGVRDHFRDIAGKATAGQLRFFLDMLDRGGDDDEDKPLLVESYIDRRMEVFTRLKSFRS